MNDGGGHRILSTHTHTNTHTNTHTHTKHTYIHTKARTLSVNKHTHSLTHILSHTHYKLLQKLIMLENSSLVPGLNLHVQNYVLNN